jgi:hypothetical protein
MGMESFVPARHGVSTKTTGPLPRLRLAKTRRESSTVRSVGSTSSTALTELSRVMDPVVYAVRTWFRRHIAATEISVDGGARASTF